MRLHLDTPPDGLPVTLAEVKNHRRVTFSADDSELTGLISAAVELVQGDTGRQLITATWRGTMDAFPASSEPIRIPLPPLQQVSEITYVDSAGVTRTWDEALYAVSTFSGPFASEGLVRPVYGESYPAVQRGIDAVTVTFIAGYGDTSTDVPLALRALVKDYVGGLYENRETHQDVVLHLNPVAERVLNRFRRPVYA